MPVTALVPRSADPAARATILVDVASLVPVPVMAVVDAGGLIDWSYWLTAVVAAGAAVRLACLFIGWRRLRSACLALPQDRSPLFLEIAAAVDARAVLVWLAGASHPFTFGSHPAVVVMPADLASAPRPTLRAIFTHELLHVARRDWRWLLAEEAATALLWFHPAIRLVLRELRQAREEVVDRATIALTGARRTYVETLVHLAGRPPASAALSLSFFKARQLPRRITALLSEAPMSRTRFVCTSLLVLAGSAASVTAAVHAFPLPSVAWSLADGFLQQAPASEPGPLERQAYVAPRDAPPPARTHYVAPKLPASATDQIEIGLRIVVDASGSVAEARALTVTADGLAPETARAATASVVEAVRQWHFERPAMAPLALTTTMTVEPSSADGTRSSRERPIPIDTKNPEYPDDARAAGAEGLVHVEIAIDRQGRVESTKVIKAPLPSMGDAAAAALKGWTFRPATKDGQAVPATVTIAVRFALQ